MIKSTIAFILAFFAVCTIANATVTYSYTGNTLNFGDSDTLDRVNIQFVVDQPLQDNFTGSLNIISGTLTTDIKNNGPFTTQIDTVDIATDSNGNIAYWAIANTKPFSNSNFFSVNDPKNAFDNTSFFTKAFTADCGNVCDFVYIHGDCGIYSTQNCSGPHNYDVNSPGMWTSVASESATPEPATWALMMVGVGAVGTALRNRRRNVDDPAGLPTRHQVSL